MTDWATRRAQYICKKIDDLQGYKTIISGEFRLVRRWALEEAAEVAERMYTNGQIGPDIAAAIRALANPSSSEPSQ